MSQKMTSRLKETATENDDNYSRKERITKHRLQLIIRNGANKDLLRSQLTDLTVCAFKPVHTFTLVAIHQVNTSTPILTRPGGAFIDIWIETQLNEMIFVFKSYYVPPSNMTPTSKPEHTPFCFELQWKDENVAEIDFVVVENSDWKWGWLCLEGTNYDTQNATNWRTWGVFAIL